MTARHVVLVCGGRDYLDAERVNAVLDQLHAYMPITRIVQGGASGADKAAAEWAERSGVECRTYAPGWRMHGRAAGPIRNQRMLDEEKPDLVIGFPGGRGTKDMLTRARAFGCRVETHELATEKGARA